MFTMVSLMGKFFMTSPIGKVLQKYLLWGLALVVILGSGYFIYKQFVSHIEQNVILSQQLIYQAKVTEELSSELTKRDLAYRASLIIIESLNKDIETLNKEAKVKEVKVINKIIEINKNPHLTDTEKDHQTSEVYIEDLNEVYCLAIKGC